MTDNLQITNISKLMENCITFSHSLSESEMIWGFESPSGRDIFCLNIFDTFIGTFVCVSKMNAAAHAQLTFQMLTSPEPVSKTWDSKCLVLIAKIVRAFGVNLKVGGSSPPQVETFFVSITLMLSQEHLFVC